MDTINDNAKAKSAEEANQRLPNEEPSVAEPSETTVGKAVTVFLIWLTALGAYVADLGDTAIITIQACVSFVSATILHYYASNPLHCYPKQGDADTYDESNAPAKDSASDDVESSASDPSHAVTVSAEALLSVVEQDSPSDVAELNEERDCDACDDVVVPSEAVSNEHGGDDALPSKADVDDALSPTNKKRRSRRERAKTKRSLRCKQGRERRLRDLPPKESTPDADIVFLDHEIDKKEASEHVGSSTNSETASTVQIAVRRSRRLRKRSTRTSRAAARSFRIRKRSTVNARAAAALESFLARQRKGRSHARNARLCRIVPLPVAGAPAIVTRSPTISKRNDEREKQRRRPKALTKKRRLTRVARRMRRMSRWTKKRMVQRRRVLARQKAARLAHLSRTKALSNKTTTTAAVSVNKKRLSKRRRRQERETQKRVRSRQRKADQKDRRRKAAAAAAKQKNVEENKDSSRRDVESVVPTTTVAATPTAVSANKKRQARRRRRAQNRVRARQKAASRKDLERKVTGAEIRKQKIAEENGAAQFSVPDPVVESAVAVAVPAEKKRGRRRKKRGSRKTNLVLNRNAAATQKHLQRQAAAAEIRKQKLEENKKAAAFSIPESDAEVEVVVSRPVKKRRGRRRPVPKKVETSASTSRSMAAAAARLARARKIRSAQNVTQSERLRRRNANREAQKAKRKARLAKKKQSEAEKMARLGAVLMLAANPNLFDEKTTKDVVENVVLDPESDDVDPLALFAAQGGDLPEETDLIDFSKYTFESLKKCLDDGQAPTTKALSPLLLRMKEGEEEENDNDNISILSLIVGDFEDGNEDDDDAEDEFLEFYLPYTPVKLFDDEVEVPMMEVADADTAVAAAPAEENVGESMSVILGLSSIVSINDESVVDVTVVAEEAEDEVVEDDVDVADAEALTSEIVVVEEEMSEVEEEGEFGVAVSVLAEADNVEVVEQVVVAESEEVAAVVSTVTLSSRIIPMDLILSSDVPEAVEDETEEDNEVTLVEPATEDVPKVIIVAVPKEEEEEESLVVETEPKLCSRMLPMSALVETFSSRRFVLPVAEQDDAPVEELELSGRMIPMSMILSDDSSSSVESESDVEFGSAVTDEEEQEVQSAILACDTDDVEISVDLSRLLLVLEEDSAVPKHNFSPMNTPSRSKRSNSVH